MKRIIFILSVALMASMLAVSAFATVSFDYDLETTDYENVYKIVVKINDDEGDIRGFRNILTFDYNTLIPADYYDGSTPDVTVNPDYPVIVGTYTTGSGRNQKTTELKYLANPIWTLNGAESTVEFYINNPDFNTNPYSPVDLVALEIYFSVANGKTVDDFTSNTFQVSYINYSNGNDNYYGEKTPGRVNNVVVTNNVVPEAVAITIPVVAGDKIYLQDGSVVTAAETTDAYEVPATVGYVAVNTGNTAQATWYVDGTTAEKVHTNGVFESAYNALRDRTPVYDKATEETEDRNGIRFMFNHNPETREVVNHEVVEVGFIITAESAKVIGAVGENYVLDMDMVNSGYAKVGKVFGDGRNTAMNTDKDDAWVMSAVFYNIPITEAGVQTKIVSRPYYKVGDAYIYGEVASASLYEKAREIKNDAEKWDVCEKSMQDYINEIIAAVEGWTEIVEDEIVIDISGLYE